MPITIDIENLKHRREESLQKIRINPPSSQWFSAAREFNKPNPSKAHKSRLMVHSTSNTFLSNPTKIWFLLKK
ncbi:hypothetical protein PHAVU_005G018900 [Phaseolus vulgaris]|uniref:Uncharacterized protein n=1 Tax=Phaseolus vulgaris TaxID=3885 RepID=V7BS55_PHAVU|nr:hypothetical protein PHAVU_005G018900g [Phaseolus vulgaris]XP_007148844.1 hypothetical protein PHAVU_005G018900g [Phaseolus vulgaris]ESW20837.1 hypothetical protein PHAVU_005G018900g [Phaseolus vulgaris]ESW20838.1 hypothetical protein PHAVU_005G018900g [Phaseolus vulgaris]